MLAINELGIKPKAERHVQEIVFSTWHGIPLEQNKPEHCRSYRGGYLDLIGKGTVVVLPSGEKIGFGLKSTALHKFGTFSVIRHKVLSVPVKTRKRGIE